MEKEFIPYEQALALKELGFDEKCLSYPMSNTDASGRTWTSVIVAPLYQQAFRWFREKYNIYVEISFNQKYENSKFGYIIRSKSSCLHTRDFPYKTYEEAELECLKKLIEIVKQK